MNYAKTCLAVSRLDSNARGFIAKELGFDIPELKHYIYDQINTAEAIRAMLSTDFSIFGGGMGFNKLSAFKDVEVEALKGNTTLAVAHPLGFTTQNMFRNRGFRVDCITQSDYIISWQE